MSFNWCHGPECHTKVTTDRVRGTKGNKVLRTRKIRETNWNKDNVWSHFCSQGCWLDFMNKHWSSAIALGPRNEPLETPVQVTKVKHSGTQYDWGRTRDWTETKIEEVVDSTSTNSVG